MEEINGWDSKNWNIDMEFVAEIPLKKGEFILTSEKIGEKYWLLYSQTELFAMDFETMEIKKAIKNGNAIHII